MALLSAFNPHELSEATVRAVATGRDESLNEVLATIRSNLQSQTIQHLIVTGPRGYGKSFLMRHIQLEVERIAREEGLALVVILMPEEMPHVKEPETLIRELTRGLTGGGAEAAELTWHEDDGAGWEAAIAALDAVIRERVGANGLVVAAVENFDLLLRRAFARDIHASRLRALLTQSGGRLMLMAASASGAFDRDYDDRLFQAFREVALGPWSVEECLAFFDRQRREAGKPPLDDTARARAKAVASFIGGTPRLATLLGEALLEEDVLRAAELLQRLVDELTPYCKERIEALPGRSQKLLDALLRGGEPATQSTLAGRVRANSQSAIAGPFTDLVRERMVIGEKAPDSAEVLYRVADRVFAQYYRRRIIAHGEGACALEGLVDLLADYFSPEEKQAKAAELARLGRIDEARLMARLHDADRGGGKGARWWVLYDLRSYYVPERLLPLASDAVAEPLRAVADLAAKGEVGPAYARIESALLLTERLEDRVLLLLARSRLDAYEGIEGGLAAADEAIVAAERCGDMRFELTAKLGRAWSFALVGRHARVLAEVQQLAERARSAGLGREEAVALSCAAFGLGQLGRREEAVATALQAADLARQAGDRCEEAVALRLAAFSLGVLGRHEEAVATAHQAADLAHQIGDRREEAVALRYAAFSLAVLGRHEEAVATAHQAADLAHQIGDQREEAIALCDAAIGLRQLGRHQEAAASARQAADLAHQIGDEREEAIALRHAVFSLERLGRPEEAVAIARQAAELAHQIGDQRVEAEFLRYAALSLLQLGRHEEAIASVRQAADLAHQTGDQREEALALGLTALGLGPLGRYSEAIDAAAASADVLTASPDEEVSRLLMETTAWIGRSAAQSLSAGARDLDALHSVLGAAERLDGSDIGRRCLQSWIGALTGEALHRIEDADKLDGWAAAIDLHFPERFVDESDRLRQAAQYHRSGRDPTALARVDPDLARTLRIMFPPAPGAEPEKKPARKRAGRRRAE